ncbi:Beta-lactamase [compost metagenome]
MPRPNLSPTTLARSSRHIWRLTCLASLLGAITTPAFADSCPPEKLQVVARYFSSATPEAPENYRNAYKHYPSRLVHASGQLSPLAQGVPLGNVEFSYDGKSQRLDEFLAATRTSAFLVLQDGKVRNEQYFNGNGPDTPLLLNSMTKSVVSLLVGIALDQKLIASVDDPIIRYLPELKGSAYETATVRQVLDMTTAIAYPGQDPKASGRGRDIQAAAGKSFACGESLRPHPAGAQPAGDGKHGEHWLYANTNTQVLGALLERVSGMSVSTFMERNLWSRIGAEGDAYWLLDQSDDKTAIEQTWMGLNARLRDVGRIGQMVLQDGQWQGQQIVSKAWLEESAQPTAPFLQQLEARPAFGYSHQWFVPVGKDHELMGLGFGGQMLYINPAKRLVVVQLTTDPNFDSKKTAEEALVVFRSIAGSLGQGDAP